VGRSAVIPQSAHGALLNQNAVRIRSSSSKVDQCWLGYLGQSRQFHKYIISRARGSANQVRMALGGLREMQVNLPPLGVQRRTGEILSAYDRLIENSLRQIEILEKIARLLYREWFVHCRLPGDAATRFVRSDKGTVRKGWKAVPFEKILVSMSGGDWGSDVSTDAESAEVSIVRGTDFDEVAYGAELRTPIRYIKPSSLHQRRLTENDVIVENSVNAKSRCVGSSLLVDKHVLRRLGRDAVAASFCKVFRPVEPQLAPLIHLHMQYLRTERRMEYYQHVAANGIGNFQAQRFSKEEFLTLPIDETVRSQVCNPISELIQRTSVLSSQVSNLRRTRDLLLPRLLSGKINFAEETTCRQPAGKQEVARDRT
jgi:type I restriction enzyme S subunit